MFIFAYDSFILPISMKKTLLLIFLTVLVFSCASRKVVMERYADQYSDTHYTPRPVDTTALAAKMARAIQIPTRSLVGECKHDGVYFEEFHQYLAQDFPLVNRAAQKTVINDYSIVYKFEGRDSTLAPGAFAAHIDVVPAPGAERWTYAPFSGTIAGGYVYGRGAQDMKSTLVALMEAMEQLLAEGFRPERDIYFCFGHDEEVPTVDGALAIANWFDEQGIRLEFLIDEGGTLVDGTLAKLDHVFALVGICEKGYVDMKLTVEKDGGYGSLPVRPTAVAKLSKAFIKLEKKPMKPKVTPALKLTLKTIAPYLPKKYRGIAANPGFWVPLAMPFLTKIPLTNTMVATTFTPTMLQASSLQNVIPHEVTGNINTRIISGYTREDVKEYMEKVVGDDVAVSYELGSDPTPMSDVNSIHYKRLTESIVSVYPLTVPIPYMFIANTDSRYYRRVCDNIFLFTPFVLTPEDQKRIHGVDERCSVAGLGQAAHFFIKCIEELSRGTDKKVN